MEKDVQEPLVGVDRRLSYCEVNANAADNLRLGAGPPEEVLNLPDDVTNIRFFMLEPLEGAWLRARWYRGEIDDSGELTTHPFAHPSQDEGAWGGFLVPLMPLAARIVRGILAGRFLDAASDGSATWVRVRPEGLAVARIPGTPTLASLLEDQPGAHWWPVYVRLFGDTAKLGDLLEALGQEYIPPLGGGEPAP